MGKIFQGALCERRRASKCVESWSALLIIRKTSSLFGRHWSVAPFPSSFHSWKLETLKAMLSSDPFVVTFLFFPRESF